jgi:hypothetical protein
MGVCLFVFEMEFYHVTLAGLKFMGSSAPTDSSYQESGTADMHHHAQLYN